MIPDPHAKMHPLHMPLLVPNHNYTINTMPYNNGQQSPPKKRKLAEEDISFVEIPRADLLTMTSKELEAQIKRLTALRSLTSAEQREIKRQRRLIKNREYAQTSRVKKKQFVEELRIENKILRDRIQALEQENYILRFGGSAPQNAQFPQQSHSQFDQLSSAPFVQHQQGMMPPNQSHSPTGYFVSSPSSPDSTSPSRSLPNSTEHSSEDVFSYEDSEIDHLFFPQDTSSHQTPSTSNSFVPSFVGSLCLMVILFAFGMFVPTFLKEAPIALAESPVTFEEFRTSRTLMFVETSNLAGKLIPDQTDSLTNQTSYRPLSLDHVLADENLFFAKSSESSLPEVPCS